VRLELFVSLFLIEPFSTLVITNRDVRDWCLHGHTVSWWDYSEIWAWPAQSQDSIELLMFEGMVEIHFVHLFDDLQLAYYTRTVFYTATIRLLVFCRFFFFRAVFDPRCFLKH